MQYDRPRLGRGFPIFGVLTAIAGLAGLGLHFVSHRAEVAADVSPNCARRWQAIANIDMMPYLEGGAASGFHFKIGDARGLIQQAYKTIPTESCGGAPGRYDDLVSESQVFEQTCGTALGNMPALAGLIDSGERWETGEAPAECIASLLRFRLHAKAFANEKITDAQIGDSETLISRFYEETISGAKDPRRLAWLAERIAGKVPSDALTTSNLALVEYMAWRSLQLGSDAAIRSRAFEETSRRALANSDSKEVWEARLFYYMTMRDQPALKEIFETLLKHSDKQLNGLGLYYLAWASYSAGNKEKAEGFLKDLLDNDRSWPERAWLSLHRMNRAGVAANPVFFEPQISVAFDLSVEGPNASEWSAVNLFGSDSNLVLSPSVLSSTPLPADLERDVEEYQAELSVAHPELSDRNVTAE